MWYPRVYTDNFKFPDITYDVDTFTIPTGIEFTVKDVLFSTTNLTRTIVLDSTTSLEPNKNYHIRFNLFGETYQDYTPPSRQFYLVNVDDITIGYPIELPAHLESDLLLARVETDGAGVPAIVSERASGFDEKIDIAGCSPEEPLMDVVTHVFSASRHVYIPKNFQFSTATALTAPDAVSGYIFSIHRTDGQKIGQFKFSQGETSAVFSNDAGFIEEIHLAPGDVLYIKSDSFIGSLIKDISWYIVGSLGGG